MPEIQFAKWLILKGGINPGSIFATYSFQEVFDNKIRPVSIELLGGVTCKIRSFKLEAEYPRGISDMYEIS